MKMNYISLIRRVLVCITILCLAVTSSCVLTHASKTSDQISLPAEDSVPSENPMPYTVKVKILNMPANVCLHKTEEITIEFGIEYGSNKNSSGPDKQGLPKPVPLIPSPVPLIYLGRGTGNISTAIKANKVHPSNLDPLQLYWGKTETRTITYTPNQSGQEKIVVTFSAEVERKGNWVVANPPAEISFEVKKKCVLNFHGSGDPGKYTNTLYAAFGFNDWDAVGTYDIAGSFAIEEDGIHGTGTTDYFLAYFWTGQGEMGAQGITCTREPLEGASEAEVNGDLAALAEAGTLNLEFQLAPMAFNASPVVCRDSEGGGGFSNESPAGTVPAFTLPADPVSTWGGRTILREGGDVQMELIVSPEEAES